MIRKHIDYVKKPYEFYGFADIVLTVQKKSVKKVDRLYLNSTMVI